MERSVHLFIDFLSTTHPGIAYRLVLHDSASTFAQEHDWSVIRGYSLILEDRTETWLISAHPTLTHGVRYELDTLTDQVKAVQRAASPRRVADFA
jgi:hypothetical protein